MHPDPSEKPDFDEISDSREELAGSACRLDDSGATTSPRSAMEQEKRIRREIANSNERRRMQSINAGFQTLRALLPQHEGEKLSKAAILQQTSDFIYSLEQEKTRLLTQNCQLKRLLGQQQQGADSDTAADSPASARRNASHESAEAASDEPAPPPPAERPPSPPDAEGAALRRELAELRAQLEQERHHRLLTEDRLRLAEAPPLPPLPPPGYTDRLHVAPPPPLKKPKLERAASPLRRPDASDSPALGTRLERQTVLPPLLLPEPATHQLAPVEPPRPQPVGHRALYGSSTTSRQNLDTIVEAIRHLEGDHLFQDLVPEPALEVEARLEEP
ncbi:transcription factor AP-4-like [Pollicipes pollicipes]|uniref:transcription factor AP-4-like n=1 Tax=Pollicipes pollicipes TaxID=41117 RepID=UPI0018854B2A|nr:transcription factor AP-4-like [Pollicipes pollicipes]